MVYVMTRKGKHHLVSEDAVLVDREVLSDTTAVCAVPDNGFVCVADGVGGNSGGAVASKFVLSELAKWDNSITLKSYLQKINDILIRKAKQDEINSKMATTLTGFCFEDDIVRLIHIGNSRVYIKQGRYIKQLTQDHTTYNWLLSTNQYDEAASCNRNEITNCFGGGSQFLLSKLYAEECQPFTLAILTSDGIHEYVDSDTIEDIINGEETFEEKCSMIVQKAIDNGSEDDVSVVMICLES